MTNMKAFLGYPVDFRGICFIYPPKVKDVIGMDKYGLYNKILTITQEEIYDSLHEAPVNNTPDITIPMESGMAPRPLREADSNPGKTLTPLEYILANCYNNKEFLQLTIEAFQFFTHNDVLPLYELKAFYVGKVEDIKHYKSLDDLPLLNENNFFEFQNLLRDMCGQKQEVKPDPNENPRVTLMKAKARYRDKIKQKSGQTITIDQMLVSICCMGLNITPLTIGEISFCAIQALFAMNQSKEQYDMDIRSLMAGADPKKIKPKYWITNTN